MVVIRPRALGATPIAPQKGAKGTWMSSNSKVACVPIQRPVMDVGVFKIIRQQSESVQVASPPPVPVLHLQHIYLECISGFGALDVHGAYEGMDRIEIDVCQLIISPISGHLPTWFRTIKDDRVPRLDLQSWLNRVIPIRLGNAIVQEVFCHLQPRFCQGLRAGTIAQRRGNLTPVR